MKTDDDMPADDNLHDELRLIENNAWSAMSTAKGNEFVLGNLLLALHSGKVLDGHAFIAGLRAALKLAPEVSAATRLGAEAVMASLVQCLPPGQEPGENPAGEDAAAPGPKLFH